MLRPGRPRLTGAGIALTAASAGSAAVYLGCMDVLYNLENGIYARWSGPIAGELVINLFCFTFGPFLLWFFWTNRRFAEPLA